MNVHRLESKGRIYVRLMLEETRQGLQGNAFGGWNPDWLGRDDGQKREREFVAAQAFSS